jgi:hypothetical protein
MREQEISKSHPRLHPDPPKDDRSKQPAPKDDPSDDSGDGGDDGDRPTGPSGPPSDN